MRVGSDPAGGVQNERMIGYVDQAGISLAERLARGRSYRSVTPRTSLAQHTTTSRDPLGILRAQNADRLPELVPMRMERMLTSPFAFFRGSAALMAADLAADPSSGIRVASCGDAHVSNFGFYASPQRTLVFDLNDFDEAAWAPWEWDVKRLVTSIVVGGQQTSRDESVIRDAAMTAIATYARAVRLFVSRSPLDRYFSHTDPASAMATLDKASRKAFSRAMADAEKRTADRAVRRLTHRDDDDNLRFVEEPPRMKHVEPEILEQIESLMSAYARTTNVDIFAVLSNYRAVDIVIRVVGVGSVGTRCYVVAMEDGDRNALILQAKEANESVLVQYGKIEQPPVVDQIIERGGQGARIVNLQRVLQGVSDPFLGTVIGPAGRQFFVRQFNDKKGSIDVETLEDSAFRTYAEACAITLARAHCQVPIAGEIAGYLGNGNIAGEAILEWSYAYAATSFSDFEALRASDLNPANAVAAPVAG